MKTVWMLASAAMLIGSPLIAQSSDHARILSLGPNVVIQGQTVPVQNGDTTIAVPVGDIHEWLLTVRIDDMAYSFIPRQTHRVHLRDFVVGDDVKARVEGDRVYVTLANGSETHGKLLRRERLRPIAASR